MAVSIFLDSSVTPLEWLVSVVSLTQSRVTLEGSLSKTLSRLGWPVGLSVEYLIVLSGKTHPVWVASLPRQGILNACVHACIHSFIQPAVSQSVLSALD